MSNVSVEEGKIPLTSQLHQASCASLDHMINGHEDVSCTVRVTRHDARKPGCTPAHLLRNGSHFAWHCHRILIKPNIKTESNNHYTRLLKSTCLSHISTVAATVERIGHKEGSKSTCECPPALLKLDAPQEFQAQLNMVDQITPSRTPDSTFSLTHIIEPKSHHSHTAIFVHGRGSDGEEFAANLFDSKLTDGRSLADALPGWRWVFPSARQFWDGTFQEDMPAWFEARSLTDVNSRQDLQAPGIKDSVEHVLSILDEQTRALDGNTEKVILGGISQGAAVAFWTLLSCRDPSKRLGAFYAASAWLPFADDIYQCCQRAMKTSSETSTGENTQFIESSMELLLRSLAEEKCSGILLSTPVMLGHGSDDAYVDVDLGTRARNVLTSIGFAVQWKVYEGAEQEGHWLKTPEQIDDMANFFLRLTEASS